MKINFSFQDIFIYQLHSTFAFIKKLKFTIQYFCLAIKENPVLGSLFLVLSVCLIKVRRGMRKIL